MKKYLSAILVVGAFLGLSESANAVKVFKGCVKERHECLALCFEGKDLSQGYYGGDPLKHNDPLCEAAPQTTPHGCYCDE